MRSVGAALAAVLLLAGTAAADVNYFVSPNGNVNNNGTSAATPWPTIAFVNANAVTPNTSNGDVNIYVAPGDYSGGVFPNPAGVPANGKRYRFIAANFSGTFASTAGYDSLTILRSHSGSNGRLRKPYVTIRGFKITCLNQPYETSFFVDSGGVADGVTAPVGVCFDSISHCLITAGIQDWGSDYTSYAFNTFRHNVGRISINYEGGSKALSNGTSFGYNNLVDCGLNDDFSGRLLLGNDAASMANARWVDSLTVERNSFNVAMPASGGQPNIFTYYCVQNSLSKYNTWTVQANGNPYVTLAKIRSSSRANVFRGDRITITGIVRPNQSLYWQQCCNAGGFDYTENLTMDSVWVRMPAGVPCNLYSGMRTTSIKNCVFVTGSSQAFRCDDPIIGTNVVDHNTFVAGPIPADGNRGVAGFFDVEDGWSNGATLTFTNNIIALVKPWPPTQFNACWPADVGLLVFNKLTNLNGKLTSNNNLYASFQYGDTLRPAPGQQGQGNDRSIQYATSSTPFHICSQPGDNTPWERVYVPAANDSLSRWGGAEFAAGGVDTVPGPNFNPNIGPNSIARGIGTSSTDAGALAFASASSGASEVTPSTVRFDGRGLENGETAVDTVIVTNTGGGDLVITSTTISSNQVSVSPLTATITAGNTQVFQIQYVKPSNPNTGDTSADIVFNHPAGAKPFTAVRVILDPPLPPGQANPN